MIHELMKIEEEGSSLEIQAGKIASFKTANKTMNGMRVFKDGQVTTASFVGEIAEEGLLKRCLEGQGGGVPYDYELPAGVTSSRSLATPSFRGLAGLNRAASEALDFLRSKNDRFIYSGKAYGQRSRTTLTHSLGMRHSLESDVATWWVSFKHRDSKDLMDGYFQAQSFSEFNFLDSVERHLPLLGAFETKFAPPLGLRKVIIPTPHQFLFNKLKESLRIDRYKDGTCLFAGKLGQKLFSDKFTLSDLRDDPSRCQLSPFDGEGTHAPAPLPLITKGVFQGLISDLRYGKKYGVPSTGNGQRSFDSNAHLGFHGLALEPGGQSTAELIKGMDECILVDLAMGGDTTDTGSFSLPVNLAYLYKNGQIQGRLGSFTLKSSVQEMFGPRLLAVSNDSSNRHGFNPSVIIEMEVLA